ncbi:MAG: riboflavin kinase [Candidatus Latescibacteria bacterium]|nr:riboflavin kinase [Candidatus Latescibacterota bacterium]
MEGAGIHFSGRVTRGQGRGRTLGFPTANLLPHGDKLLPQGVFVAEVQYPGSRILPAVAHIGSRPTFAEAALVIELHILDFTGDLYGQTLQVALVKKLRDQCAFACPDELVGQIRKDINQARALFSSKC